MVRVEELWGKLLSAYEGGAHTALGYSSWGAYFEVEFGINQSRGYQLLEAGRGLRAIESHSKILERPKESQARELAHAPAQAAEVWKEVNEEARAAYHTPTPPPRARPGAVKLGTSGASLPLVSPTHVDGNGNRPAACWAPLVRRSLVGVHEHNRRRAVVVVGAVAALRAPIAPQTCSQTLGSPEL